MAKQRFWGLLLGCSLLLVSLTLSAGTAQAAVAPQIAAGGTHTVALMSDGTVKAWGGIGSGSAESCGIPRSVTGLGGPVIAIAAGNSHSVALMADGSLKTWGYNYYGQLGNGTFSNSSITPVTVTGLGGPVVAIAAGGNHTVALLSDGTVKAWGYNNYGQLGNGSYASRSTPVTVTGLGGPVTAIAAGFSYTVALLADGTVKAWGDNYQGQLGNGTFNGSITPVTVTGLGGEVLAIAAGREHTIALLADGSVEAWGANGFGKLGNGGISVSKSSTPVKVIGLNGAVAAIAAGGDHTVVLLADGTVKVWGDNQLSQLGNGTFKYSVTPVTVAGLGGTVASISAGRAHSMVILTDGTIKSWGDDFHGELGNGISSIELSSTPVNVIGLGGPVAAISAGGGHTAVLFLDGSVKSWGYNYNGALGNGTKASSSTPVTVIGLNGTVAAIAAGGAHSVAFLANGTAQAWGYNRDSQLGNGGIDDSTMPVAMSKLQGTVATIAAGGSHSVALMSNCTLKAWGLNYYGQLGTGTTYDSYIPLPVTGLSGSVVAIAVGGNHSVALMSDGTVKAWGYNASGQLGNGTTTNSSTPVTVTGLSRAVAAIAAGDNHTVVLLDDGTVMTWGRNYEGQLGNATITDSSTPVIVTGLMGKVKSIAAKGNHTLALMSDGTVKAWGYNNYGQLGNGTTIKSSTPMMVNGLGNTVTAITAGMSFNMALLADGSVKAWGENRYGQLGDGNSGINPLTVMINLDNVAPTVTTDLPSGNYDGSVMVELTCSDDYSGCKEIRYTDDGNIPTTSSPLYTGPLSISKTTTLNFLATDKAGNNSGVQSVSYTIPIRYSLGLTVRGNGTVHTRPGSDMACRSGCSQNYLEGEVVTLIATPDPGYVLASWSNCTGTASCQVTMDAAKSVEATFATLVTLLAPNGGETLLDGTIIAINWSRATDAVFYDLSYSLDGGISWTFISRFSDVTSANWKLPNIKDDQPNCLVRIVALDAALNVLSKDDSDASFSIVNHFPVVLLAPNGGETLLDGIPTEISWTRAVGAAFYDLSYSLNGGTSWTFIKSVSGVTSTSWTVPDVSGDQNNCLLRIVARNGGLKTPSVDDSNSAFTIVDRTSALAPDSVK